MWGYQGARDKWEARLAQQDSFIDEVTEEVRRDRLYRLFRRYGWIAVLAVVAIVAGAAWTEWQRATARTAAEARGDAVMAALGAATPAARADAMAAASEGEAGDLAAVLQMLAAGQATPEEGLAEARARLEALAARSDVDPVYRDLAVLKAVALAGAEVPAGERIARLAPLTAPGAPYRVMALELTAYAQVDAGETEAALGVLRGLMEDAEAPQGLRQRASRMIVALGGSLETSEG